MKHLKRLRKKTIIVAAALAAVLLSSGSDVKGDMADLIKARTDILNGYYCGHINYYDALSHIREIETGRLLEEDTAAMRGFFQTDIEEVTDYKITDIELTSADEDLVCAVVDISWEVSGTGGNESIEEIYSVIMEKDEKKYKLVQFF